MSTTILRAVFMLAFAITGFLLGREAYLHLISLHVASEGWLIALLIVVPVAGAIVGLFLAPPVQSLFEVELAEVERALERLTQGELVGGAVGLIVGLLIAFLAKNVLLEAIADAGKVGTYVATLIYVLASIFAAFLGARLGAKQRLGAAAPASDAHAPERGATKLLDTSVIVDGRVLEVVQSGFLDGPLVLPRFVLAELQAIADSADALKRARGRRGLEVLAKLQEIMPLEIVDDDPLGAGPVDAKLLRLAQHSGAKLITNDFNLNRVALVEGVAVLNLNELAEALKPVVLPGEEMHVAIVRDGKEPHQGVGYLDDGTMIVVEQGRRLIGEEVDVQVTSVLQTVAGRMIFAKLKRASGVANS
ncbi:MAG: PIN/TRAM domain-containing protein [Vulcanimicrobiaceae bacterium]